MINNLLRKDLNENLTKNKTELYKTIWEKNLHNFLESFYKLFTISRKHLFQLKKIPGVFDHFINFPGFFQVFQIKSQTHAVLDLQISVWVYTHKVYTGTVDIDPNKFCFLN